MPFIDAFGNILSIPNKLMFGTADIESHVISDEIEVEIRRFMVEHDLDVHVRINEYDPLGEAWRLLTNRRVSLLLRLFFGPLVWIGYVLNVGRLFGGDHYNAFSHSVNLYSNHMSIAIHEMGHVLDFKRRRWPGLWALSRFIPGFALYQEYLASLYAVLYFREHHMFDEEIRAYRLLFPAYSTYVFGTVVDLFPSAATKWLLFPCIALGHAIGNYLANERLQAIGDASITMGGQWWEEGERAVAMFSPATDYGRTQLGVLIGTVSGSALCALGGPVGAWLGFVVAHRSGSSMS